MAKNHLYGLFENKKVSSVKKRLTKNVLNVNKLYIRGIFI